MKYVYSVDSLIGGIGGTLDNIDGDNLKNGDTAFLFDTTSALFSVYILDSDSTAAENHPYIISPDDNAGTKRWTLSSIQSTSYLTGPSSYSFIDDEDTKIYSPGSDKIAITTGGVDTIAFYNDGSDGNVGIGTITPITKLHIVKNNVDPIITLERVDPTISSSNNIGTINFRGGETTIDNIASIVVKADANWDADDSPTNMSFWTTPDNSTTQVERMRINKDGNIGIGNTSPVYPLDIYKSVDDDSKRLLNVSYDLTGTATGNRTSRGLFIDVNSYLEGLQTDGNRSAVYGSQVYVDLIGDTYTSYGSYSRISYDGDSTAALAVTTMYGAFNQIRKTGSGNIKNAYGTRSGISSTATSGSIESAYGVYSHINQDVVGSEMTNSYAFYASQDQDNGTSENAYLYYGSFSGTHTTKYGMYITGETYNYFSGPVGIGTDTPLTGLHIADTDSPSSVTLEREDSAVGSTSAVGYIYFRGGETTIANVASISVKADGDWAADDSPSRMLFYTTPSGSTAQTERIRIDSAGLVGIGADDPQTLLHIASTSTTQLTIEREDTIVSDGNAIGILNFRGGESTIDNIAQIACLADGDWANDDSPSKIQFRTTPSGSTSANNNVVIDKDGFVGIGEVDPLTRLHLKTVDDNTKLTIERQDSAVFGSAGVGEIAFRAGETTIADVASIIVESDASWNADDSPTRMKFFTTPAGSTTQAERITIKSDGSVGIGTTGPAQMLEVEKDQNGNTQIEIDNNTSGTVAGAGLKVSSSSSTVKLRTQSAGFSDVDFLQADGATLVAELCGTGLNIATSNSTAIKFWTNSIERVRMDQNGYVGIGTETPSHALDVVGDIYCTGSINRYENADIDIGTESVDEISDTTSYLACVWHYVVKKDSNLRAGTVTSCWNEGSSTVEYSETKTNDIGDTSAVTLSVDISGGNVRLRATTTGNNWLVRAVRTLF